MGLAIVLGVGAVLVPAGVGAVNVDPLQGVCETSTSQVCKDKDDKVSTTIASVINILLFIVGAISVLMIIIAGIMYAVSTGDTTRITRAKDAILYAIIGLVVSFLAYAIVNWVILRFV
jgi:cytochrome bd-type quinol oxidase subunit 2